MAHSMGEANNIPFWKSRYRIWLKATGQIIGTLALLLLITVSVIPALPDKDLALHTANIDTMQEDLPSSHEYLSKLRQQLRDFGTFYESGKAARAGLNPYDVYPLSFVVKTRIFSGANPNLNPPAALLIFAPMSMIEPALGYNLLWWTSLGVIVTGVIILVAMGPSRPRYWLALWALCYPGLWDTLHLGQIYALFFACAAGAWILLQRGRDTAAGVLIGILTAVKLSFLVWPVLLILAGHRRTATTAFKAFAVFSILPALFFGPTVYLQWAEVLVTSDPDRLRFYTNLSLTSFAARLDIAFVGMFLSAGLLGVLALWAWRLRPSVQDVGAVALVGAMLASPIAWIHYLLLLYPLLLTTKWNRPMVIGAGLLCIPLIINFFMLSQIYIAMDRMDISDTRLMHFLLSSPYSWGFLLLAIGLLTPYLPAVRALADQFQEIRRTPLK